MSGSNLAGRYAKALFELAEKNKSLDKVEGDLQQLMKAVEGSLVLRGAILSPVISKSNLSGVMAEILKRLAANSLTINFIGVLVQNGRIKHLAEVASAYLGLMMQSRGEEEAYVTTASSLDAKQIVDIENTLGKAMGHKIKAVMAVNDEILGGIIVRIGSKMLDASLSGQLEALALLNKKAIANLN